MFKKKIQKKTTIAFTNDEDKVQDENKQQNEPPVVIKKKPLADDDIYANKKISANIISIEAPQQKESSDTHKQYDMQKLREQQTNLNARALQRMKDVEELEQLGYDEQMQNDINEKANGAGNNGIIEDEEQEAQETEIKTTKDNINQENSDNDIVMNGEEIIDSDSLDQDEQNDIDQAKKYRQKKRLLNSGEYVSLKKDNEDYDDIEMAHETERIKNRIMSKSKQKEADKQKNRMLMNADEDDDAKYDPEEEEVNSWEKSILKQTISTRTMKSLNSFIAKKQKIEGIDPSTRKPFLRQKSIQEKEKGFTDYIESINKRIKQKQQKLEQNQEELQTINKRIEEANASIEKFEEKKQTEGDQFEQLQDFYDIFNDIVDCLTHKKAEAFELQNLLAKIEANYSKVFYERLTNWLSQSKPLFNGEPTVSFQLGQSQIEPSEENNTILKITSILNAEEKNFTIDEHQDLYNHLREDKDSFTEASKQILEDVVEDVSNSKKVLEKLQKLEGSTNLNPEKIQTCIQELLNCFVQIELIAFDPLNLSVNPDFQYKQLDQLKDLSQIIHLSRIDENSKLVQKAVDQVLATTVKNKFNQVINNIWNPFNLSKSKSLANVFRQYIDALYSKNPNKSPDLLVPIKELLEALTHKFRQCIEILKNNSPQKAESKIEVLQLCILLFNSILSFNKILPASNIIKICLESLITDIIWTISGDLFSIRGQYLLIEKILQSYPRDFLLQKQHVQTIEYMKPKLTLLKDQLIQENQSQLLDQENTLTQLILSV